MGTAHLCKPLLPQEKRRAETVVLSTATPTAPPHPGRNPPPGRERDAGRHLRQPARTHLRQDSPFTAPLTVLVWERTTPTRSCTIANRFHLTKLTPIFPHCFKIPESRLESPFPSHILGTDSLAALCSW